MSFIRPHRPSCNRSSCTRREQRCQRHRAAVHALIALFLCLPFAYAAAEPRPGDEAAPMRRVPGSPDPVLRATPLERQRVAPEPTPGLRIPARAGRQTIVMHDYLGSFRAHPPALPPVVLFIPDGFFSRHTSSPQEVWGLNLSVRYPEMQPFPVRKRTCWGYCDGYVHLTLQNRDPGLMTRWAQQYRAHVAEAASKESPAVTYVHVEPPPGYTEAYVETLTTRNPPEMTLVYMQDDGSGAATEYAMCRPTARSPACRFFMHLASLPQLEVQYSVSMDFWDRRDEVKAAVLGEVRSFLSP